jgi:hypothetical protein
VVMTTFTTSQRGHQSEKYQASAASLETSLGAKPKAVSHGDNGPLAITQPEWCPDVRRPYIDALSSLGLKNNPDPVSTPEFDRPARF